MTANTLKRAAIALLGTIAIPAMVAAQETPLTIGMSTTATTLDPHEDSSAPNNATSRHIWDRLIKPHRNLGECAGACNRVEDRRPHPLGIQAARGRKIP
jgi:hypothetical protein